MSATQQDVIAALQGESTDLTTFGGILKSFIAAVDKLLSTAPSAPDFGPIMDQVSTNRNAISGFLSSLQAEDAKVEPPAPVTPSVTVSPTSLSLNVGDVSAAISATVNDGSTVSFSVNDPTIATVDASGVVTAVAAGSTAVNVVTTSGASATVSVTVSAPASA